MTSSRTERSPALADALRRLFALQTFGIKLGLEPIAALLEEVGNPHHDLAVVHVAGTNGKGSVCSLLASVLSAAGHRVGLYTSPHLVDFSERIRIDGVPIEEEALAEIAVAMMPAIERHNCTFFEGTTAIALRHFAGQKVDVAVIETGMGGRLDATNIVTPLLSVVTGIALDHTRHLGATLELIAHEKGGIIKSNAPAVVGPLSSDELRTIFRERGEEVGTVVHLVDESCRAALRSITLEGITGAFQCEGWEPFDDLAIGLGGRHQLANGRTALLALRELRERFGVSPGVVRRGFAEVRERSGVRGRLEYLPGSPATLLDVAHNPDGVRALADTLEAVGLRDLPVVIGAVEEKDIEGMLALLAPHVRRVHAVRAATHRARPVEDVLAAARAVDLEAIDCGTVAGGLRSARADAGEEGTVLVCGSFYVVGEAISAIEEERGEEGKGSGRKGEVRDREEPAYIAGRRPTVREWDRHLQPRERLLDHGADQLRDDELLAILLNTGTKKRNVMEVASDLLQMCNGRLTDLLDRSIHELAQVHGVGEAKAVTIAAALELAKRVRARQFDELPLVRGPEDVARIFIPRFLGVMKEEFHVVFLNTAGRMTGSRRVSEGSLGSAVVHPREVYHPAVVARAAAIIGLHNHPSGNPQASREDIAITRQLVEAGRALGIPFNDHLIIAGERWVSLAELGHIS